MASQTSTFWQKGRTRFRPVSIRLNQFLSEFFQPPVLASAVGNRAELVMQPVEGLVVDGGKGVGHPVGIGLRHLVEGGRGPCPSGGSGSGAGHAGRRHGGPVRRTPSGRAARRCCRTGSAGWHQDRPRKGCDQGARYSCDSTSKRTKRTPNVLCIWALTSDSMRRDVRTSRSHSRSARRSRSL